MPYIETEPKLIGSGHGLKMYLVNHKQEGQCVSMSPPAKVLLVSEDGSWTARFESRSTHNAIQQAKNCIEMFAKDVWTGWGWEY